MSSDRMKKVGNVLEREVAIAIRNLFSIEESGVFSIRAIQVFPDFSEARIYISTFGGAKDFIPRLNHAKNRIQRKIAPKLPFRRFPHFVFYEDNTGEEAEKMEELLQK